MQGILLFAHGARDPAWARPFETIAARMREAAGGRPVALAYLELMEPRLDAAAHALAAQGCTLITVVPLFLGAGGHVRRDLLQATLQNAGVAPHCTRSTKAVNGDLFAMGLPTDLPAG